MIKYESEARYTSCSTNYFFSATSNRRHRDETRRRREGKQQNYADVPFAETDETTDEKNIC